MAEEIWQGPVLLQSKNFPGYKMGLNADKEAFITETGRRFQLVPALCGDGGAISFRSYDHQDHYLRHYNFELFCDHETEGRNPESMTGDGSFVVHKDRWFPGYFSFESVNFPGHFIRHCNWRLMISDEGAEEDPELFSHDASFRLVEGPFKLQSRNFPDHQVAVEGDEAYIRPGGSDVFLVRPGLHGGPAAVSVLPCCPDHDHNRVLRHYDSELCAECPDDCRNPECVEDDASFSLVDDAFNQGFFALQSVNFPDSYVRHSDYRLRIDPDDGSELMHDDASFRTVKGPVTFSSYNFPDQGIGFNEEGEGWLGENMDLFWLVAPGLNKEPGTVTFEAASRPGHVFRHYDYQLDLEERGGARNEDCLPDDSTFHMRQDPWFENTVAFESVNFPGHFLRHQDSRLKIGENDGSDLFKEDASFTAMY